MKRLLLLSSVVALVIVVSACGQSSEPAVSDAWVRSAPEGVPVSAAYMTIKGDDTLVSVSVPGSVAASAELHKTTTTPSAGGQMMGMEPAGPVAVNGSLQLKPGGYHVMLMGVKKPLVVGERVAVTLKFKEYGNLVVEAPVRDNA